MSTVCARATPFGTSKLLYLSKGCPSNNAEAQKLTGGEGEGLLTD